ncbi:nucleotidyltransferase family protein [Kordiimonas sp. SCSIO 12603]|uniref:nucleotidyltransferase family protein n=1 Tax=Kordiimonas sp. SCSIO 12603 TaxID=2829596 RepID=UPI0021083121|nr:nucleotidyltransferase family protein [Kordiimonas sp. SCSIO 12603]UTW57568.1 nucleotidyltransferase family protein [Kordiimonas sp. SCSIO 12603]
MSRYFTRVIAGLEPIPENVTERALLLEFADVNHVFGRLALVAGDTVSKKMQSVLENGVTRAAYDHHMLHSEKERLERAFMGSGIQPILLKGGAYVALGLEAAKGRRVSDLDILVPEQNVKEAEEILLAAGWNFDESAAEEYDQHYYRKHMHELPPFRHSARFTILDVHHRLLPPTSRLNINNKPFFEAAMPLVGSFLKVLSPQDLFIHSAIHAFADGTFETPVRSLIELNLLLSDLDSDEDLALLERIKMIGAEKPCAYAFGLLAKVLDSERADDLLKELGGVPSQTVLDWFVDRLNGNQTRKSTKAMLYLRSHLLRMPLYRLLPHLVVKAFKRIGAKPHPVRLPEIQ